MKVSQTVWTIGHSTRTIDELIAALRAFEIDTILDVRRFPGSRRLPQFGADELEKSLSQNGIGYKWLPALGGRRVPIPDSPNGAWINSAFRGYADYAETVEFAEGLEELLMLAGGMRVAIMCAELLWWRCHRRIISDVLVSIGFEVIHIRESSFSEIHKLSAPARMIDGELSYQPISTQLDQDDTPQAQTGFPPP